jgi:hypothetical protein
LTPPANYKYQLNRPLKAKLGRRYKLYSPNKFKQSKTNLILIKKNKKNKKPKQNKKTNCS